MSTRYEYFRDLDTTQYSAYGSSWVSQTFTPSIAHKITSVKLLLFRDDASSPGTVTVGIRATDGSGHPTGPDLCSGTTDGNTLAENYPYEWREITLGVGYNLDADTMYAIVLRAPDATSDSRVRWRNAQFSSATYAGGMRETSDDSGLSWTSDADRDHSFEEWGEPLVSAPAVTTESAISIEETTANPRGDVTNTGGENPTRYIDYGTSSGSYPWNKNCGVGGTGVYNSNLTGLSPGTKYYFRARAVNSAGTGTGSELSFTTKPNPPTNLSCSVISQTQINLTWSKGSGAEKTLIRRKVGSYPTSVTDGDQVYFDTGTSYNDTTCSCGTNYFYRAWSYKTGAPNSGYSDATSDDNATTLPCGWTGKISGVTNPAKIMGVDVANIAKVKGVA